MIFWSKLQEPLRQLKYKFQRPIITRPGGKNEPGASVVTFVVIVGPTFNQTIPNAATTSRMGWCHGFEQLGIPYLILSVFELARRLPELTNPICWLSGGEYQFLNRANLAALKTYRHLVWVNTWFDDEAKFYRRHNLENNSWPETLNQKILSSEPSLVFTISPESGFDYYCNWQRAGAKLVSLPLACDTTLYHPETPNYPEFHDVEMAFVGGYWPYKARQFDRYLKPYQDKLTVFGYSKWPYAGYGGQLPVEKEASLYRQTCLSPTINEPQIEIMGVDLNERVFKVLGSGGMTITDVAPGYREWFTEDELLSPRTLTEYHDLTRRALTDVEFNKNYRQQGLQAVLNRHTYAHRARQVLEYFEIGGIG